MRSFESPMNQIIILAQDLEAPLSTRINFELYACIPMSNIMWFYRNLQSEHLGTIIYAVSSNGFCLVINANSVLTLTSEDEADL